MDNSRAYGPLDHLVLALDAGLRTVWGVPPTTGRPCPGADTAEAELAPVERARAGCLMRVNHSGEVAAQARYQGQALTARLPDVRGAMEQAAAEENDHLAWCESRLDALGAHKSLLNPFWYAGSFVIGALAGAAGDKWSLGFLAETERQVVAHLDRHLERLPAEDEKSRAVLEQMRVDEGHHATTALEAGGADLPYPVRRLMRLASKVMTETAYYL